MTTLEATAATETRNPGQRSRTMKTITEHATAAKAIEHAAAEGSEAFAADGHYLTGSDATATAAWDAADCFAWLCDVKGQIVTVPVPH